jgi:sugar phosphate isomerase/epimerase
MKENVLGLTTKTFSKAVKRGAVTWAEVIRWAAANGFGWIELRDSLADMEDDELGRLGSIARDSGLAMQYAWDGTNLLADSARSLFARGLAKASKLPGVRFCRVTIAGEVFKDDRARLGYTIDETRRISSEMVRLAEAAEGVGITLAFENSHEPLCGDGAGFLGIRELLQRIDVMNLVFDPANFLSLRSPLRAPGWDALATFYDEFSSRIPYIHLKSAGAGGFLPSLEIRGEEEAACIHRMCGEGKLLCIELPEADEVDTGMRNVLAARDAITVVRESQVKKPGAGGQ